MCPNLTPKSLGGASCARANVDERTPPARTAAARKKEGTFMIALAFQGCRFPRMSIFAAQDRHHPIGRIRRGRCALRSDRAVNLAGDRLSRLCVQRLSYGISILETVIEAPFSSPVSLTVRPACVARS